MRSSSDTDHCDIVRSFLYDHIDRVFASLVHGCRFECVYGTSSRCALIMVIPSAECDAVVDFYEAEREAGDGGDDDLYVKRTSYGQVHRLAELWNLLVSVGVFRAFHAVLLRAVLAVRVCGGRGGEFRRGGAAELSVRAAARVERGEQIQGDSGAGHSEAVLHRRALRTRVRALGGQQVAR